MDQKCQALSDEFERCEKLAVAEVEYSGDVKELNPRYVLVYLCDQHAGRRPGKYSDLAAYKAE